MPRKARILVPNCPHHIVQRGHNRNAVFIADEDYQFYLENLAEWKEKLGVKLYTYCLMTNHVHLVVEPGDRVESLSLLMKRLAGRQAAYVNKLERRTGSLWEGRFKASPIQRDEYLLACCRYVDLNPVSAGMVAKPEDYAWSGYRERVGLSPRRKLLDEDCALGLISGANEKNRYQELVLSGMQAGERNLIGRALERNQLTGDSRFVDEIEQRIGVRLENRGRGRPARNSGSRGQI